MSDSVLLRQHRHRVRTAPAGSYELGYLEPKLGASRQQVLDAIRAVGNDRTKVAQYLRANR